MEWEKGKYLSDENRTDNKTKPRKWTDSEIEYMLNLKKQGKSLIEICNELDRSIASVQVKLKRLKKRDKSYNSKHIIEKNNINKKFVTDLNPVSILDLYSGNGNPSYNELNVVSNDINPKCNCDYNMDALKCISKLYSENKSYDVIDLDPFGSAYDCFDLAIKMAKKGLCVTLGEMGHKRWKRLDFVKYRYGISNLNEFTSDNLIKKIQQIGLYNKKLLIVYAHRDWANISRVWFVIKPYKETSQWKNNSFDYEGYYGKSYQVTF